MDGQELFVLTFVKMRNVIFIAVYNQTLKREHQMEKIIESDIDVTIISEETETETENSENQNTKKTKNIYLIGEVNEDMNREIIEELTSINYDNVDTLNIYISSSGGLLHDCFSMIDMFLFIKEAANCTINTFGLGCIASAGFFLFLLGDNRYLFPNCRVFVHEHISLGEEGKPYTKKLADLSEDKRLYKMYTTYVHDRLGVTINKAQTLLKKDSWLSDKEIIEFNINTGEIYEDE